MRFRPVPDVHIRSLQPTGLGRLAAFLARLNAQPEHHIGYCGADEAEVLHALQHDFDEVSAQAAFVLAEQGENLVGALGFDADLATGHVELWGPFAEGAERVALAERLWDALTPPRATRLELFCNAENALCADFALRHGFTEGPRTEILSVIPNVGIGVGSALELRDFGDFIRLHDALFPGTYYSGAQILTRFGPYRQVFVEHDMSGLCGYAYAEAAPEFAEGSLEFVGVAPRSRGQGLGARLVRAALAWLASVGVREVTLTVSSHDEAAGRLYRRAGFTLRHNMRTFRKFLADADVEPGSV